MIDEKITAMRFQAQNGDILTLSCGEDTSIFTYQSDVEECEVNKKLQLLFELKEWLFDPDNKFSEKNVCINMYAAPGSKASTEAHVSAFLNDFLFAPSDDLIKKVSELIEKDSEDLWAIAEKE